MRRHALPFLLVLPLLAACPVDDDEPLEEAEVRALHLSPNAPPVDIFVNRGETAAVRDLDYGEGTAYLSVPSGRNSFFIVPAGGTIDDRVLAVRGVEMDPDERYSVVAFNVVEDLRALVLLDDDSGIQAGDTRLQIAHTAAGVGEVDIWDLDTETLIVEDLDFGEATRLDVEAGARRIGLDVDGDAKPDFVFDVPDLGADRLVNVYAVLDTGAMAPHLIAHFPDGSVARVDAELEDD